MFDYFRNCSSSAHQVLLWRSMVWLKVYISFSQSVDLNLHSKSQLHLKLDKCFIVGWKREKSQRWFISTTNQAIKIVLATPVGHFLHDLDFENMYCCFRGWHNIKHDILKDTQHYKTRQPKVSALNANTKPPSTANQLAVHTYCGFSQNTQLTTTMTIKYLGVPDSVLHDLFPVAVNHLEEATFLRHLLHDVFWAEDRLQVQPLGLHFEPFVNGVLGANQCLLPHLHTALCDEMQAARHGDTHTVLHDQTQAATRHGDAHTALHDQTLAATRHGDAHTALHDQTQAATIHGDAHTALHDQTQAVTRHGDTHSVARSNTGSR